MKKLIMSIAVVVAAIASHAATVNWSAGYLYAPNADGSIITTGGVLGAKLGDAYNVKMYVWEALTADALSYESGDLFAWYQNTAADKKDPFGGNLTAINGTYAASTSQANANGLLSGVAGQDTIYGAVLFVLEDKVTGDAVWYMENDASKAASTSVGKVNALGMYENGIKNNGFASYTAVPEPTSGLLMLVGLAGLALRRRRA